MLLIAGSSGPAAAGDIGSSSEQPKVAPGSVIRWLGDGVDECRLGDHDWAPHDGACWYPVDLRRDPGPLRVERTRGGASEHATVEVTNYPYPTQRLSVDPKMVDPPSDQLDRIRREKRRVAGIWRLTGPAAFELPLHPPITPVPSARSFGSRRVFNGKPGNPHSGADLSASTGTPVLAAAGGTVVIADAHYFSGKSVFIDHGNDLITMYFHLDRIDVEEGQTVARGQAIGTVGSTGRVTGPHLHFGVRWHGARVDPAVLLADPASVPVIDTHVSPASHRGR